jgi:hypothetical protein
VKQASVLVHAFDAVGGLSVPAKLLENSELAKGKDILDETWRARMRLPDSGSGIPALDFVVSRLNSNHPRASDKVMGRSLVGRIDQNYSTR